MRFHTLTLPFFTILAAALLSPVVADDSNDQNGAEGHEVIRLSEPVHSTADFEDFGTLLPEQETAMSLDDALAQLDQLDGESVLIETEIQQVCQKKGCFFIARDDQNVARVRFQDYGFFIPTDSAGKTVTLAGTIARVELSPEQAAHFAEDLGDDASEISAPDFEYQIMATSVRIPRA